MALISHGLFVAAVAAYIVAAGVFGLLLLGAFNRDGTAIAAVPYSILTGMILNGCGAVAAIVGFFVKAERRWACVVALLLNSAPPLVAFALMAVGFVLIG